MDKQSFTIYNESIKLRAVEAVMNASAGCRVDVKPPVRSLDQNAISHAWYEQLGKELREDDSIGWKCACKLWFGVPILRAEDEDFRSAYDSAIKGLDYEQKLTAMKILPVTSLMTKAQLSKYLEAMQGYFLGRGVHLKFPEVPL